MTSDQFRECWCGTKDNGLYNRDSACPAHNEIDELRAAALQEAQREHPRLHAEIVELRAALADREVRLQSLLDLIETTDLPGGSLRAAAAAATEVAPDDQ